MTGRRAPGNAYDLTRFMPGSYSGDVDAPIALLEVARVDAIALDHRQSDGTAQGVAVGSGPHITHRLAVAQHDLGMDH